GARVERLRKIAREIALAIGADASICDRAAMLCKTDLLTGMVGEFPELQGIMGGYYARHDGEPEEVAAAIQEHYRPRYAGDAMPASQAGTIVALADKLETLAGLFGIGQLPTGDKDPFALRRHALGIIRMVIDKRLDLPLARLLGIAFEAFEGSVPDPRGNLADFFNERLAGWLRDRGFNAQEIDCVVSQRPDDLAQVPARLEAVRAFAALPEAASLSAANKRIGNL
ncbi:MAG: glycine--tRNA ligase subunit beta, partial [Quisquiliibacterium sp.]